MLGQGQATLFLVPIRLATLRTSGVKTAPNLEREPQDCCQGGDGTVVMIGSPQRLTTGGAMAQKWLQSLHFGGDRSRGCTCHSRYLHESSYSRYRYHLPPTLAYFASLEKNQKNERLLIEKTGRLIWTLRSISRGL